MKKLTFALALALASTGAQSATLDIVSLIITGGGWATETDPPLPADAECSNDDNDFSSFKCIKPGANNTITMGSYGGGDNNLETITNFSLFTIPVYTFTAASAVGTTINPTGVPNGIVDTDAGTMTVDLGGFYMSWEGKQMHTGTNPSGVNGTSVAATGTYDPLSDVFDITWQSYIVDSPFDTVTFYWHLTGTAEVSAVPVPAAVWLLGSGLLVLLGFSRKDKK